MSTFTTTTLVKQATSKDIPVDKRIDKDRYDCYMAVDGTTADKLIMFIYVRKDQTITTPSTAVWTYT